MVFTKSLREGVRRGRIRCSVRIWQSPRVRVGARYPMEEGAIEIDSIVTEEGPHPADEIGALISRCGACAARFLGIAGDIADCRIELRDRDRELIGRTGVHGIDLAPRPPRRNCTRARTNDCHAPARARRRPASGRPCRRAPS